MWPQSFISQQDFLKHIHETIQKYGEKLAAYNLDTFNRNIVDPIKLIFDKTVYNFSWEEIIKNEIFRQRDKSANNSIGYFHQGMFQYIENCTVPSQGWDVIFSKDKYIELPEGDKVKTVFVEMKNKHNTMNDASSVRTYTRMQHQLLNDDNCACFLVEVIAKQSQNIPWAVSIDGTKQKHRLIRRVSIDEFYNLVTGVPDAFYQMCMILPDVIEEVVKELDTTTSPKDTVFNTLRNTADSKGGSFALALYLLGFNSYTGFKSI